MAFATTDDLADVLGYEVDPEDAQALAALDAATALIQAYTGQTIEQVADDVITLDGSGTRVLLLPELPVTNVASVSVDGEALAATDYQWSADGYLRRTGSATWPADLRSVEVEYTHGYAVLPALIVSLTAKLAARHLEVPTAVRQEAIGAYSTTYVQPGLQADELTLLDRWRKG
jgi:hypothetical protein